MTAKRFGEETAFGWCQSVLRGWPCIVADIEGVMAVAWIRAFAKARLGDLVLEAM